MSVWSKPKSRSSSLIINKWTHLSLFACCFKNDVRTITTVFGAYLGFLTFESLRTFTHITIYIVYACCVILARIGHAFIHIDFTSFPWKIIKKNLMKKLVFEAHLRRSIYVQALNFSRRLYQKNVGQKVKFSLSCTLFLYQVKMVIKVLHCLLWFLKLY